MAEPLYETFGGHIPQRKQRFDAQAAGKQVRPSGVSFPNMTAGNFNPKLLHNPQKQNPIWILDPMTATRHYMVSPCKEDNASTQRFRQLNGVYAQPYNVNPIDPLSKLGINLHDRLGPFKLADFSQKPFYQSSMY